MLRTLLAAAVISLASIDASAAVQPRENRAAVQAQEDAMKKLDFLVGRWEGEATITAPGGQKSVLRQHEDVQFKIGRKVLLVEGTGRIKEGPAAGRVVYEALGTVSYDPVARSFRMRAYGSEGLSVDPTFVVGEKAIQWSFSPVPGIDIRYDVKIDDRGHWVETGDRSTDGGQTWTRFIELDLERLTDGDATPSGPGSTESSPAGAKPTP
jgi:hypothetical protein